MATGGADLLRTRCGDRDLDERMREHRRVLQAALRDGDLPHVCAADSPDICVREHERGRQVPWAGRDWRRGAADPNGTEIDPCIGRAREPEKFLEGIVVEA